MTLNIYCTSQFLWVRNSGRAWLDISGYCSQILAGAVVTWKQPWNWRICSQGGSLTWLTSWCWPLVGGLRFSVHGPLHRAAGESSQYGHWLSPWWATQENKHHNSLDGLISQVTAPHRLAWFCVREDYTQPWTPRDNTHWRPCWRMANTTTGTLE